MPVNKDSPIENRRVSNRIEALEVAKEIVKKSYGLDDQFNETEFKFIDKNSYNDFEGNIVKKFREDVELAVNTMAKITNAIYETYQRGRERYALRSSERNDVLSFTIVLGISFGDVYVEDKYNPSENFIATGMYGMLHIYFTVDEKHLREKKEIKVISNDVDLEYFRSKIENETDMYIHPHIDRYSIMTYERETETNDEYDEPEYEEIEYVEPQQPCLGSSALSYAVSNFKFVDSDLFQFVSLIYEMGEFLLYQDNKLGSTFDNISRRYMGSSAPVNDEVMMNMYKDIAYAALVNKNKLHEVIKRIESGNIAEEIVDTIELGSEYAGRLFDVYEVIIVRNIGTINVRKEKVMELYNVANEIVSSFNTVKNKAMFVTSSMVADNMTVYNITRYLSTYYEIPERFRKYHITGLAMLRVMDEMSGSAVYNFKGTTEEAKTKVIHRIMYILNENKYNMIRRSRNLRSDIYTDILFENQKIEEDITMRMRTLLQSLSTNMDIITVEISEVETENSYPIMIIVGNTVILNSSKNKGTELLRKVLGVTMKNIIGIALRYDYKVVKRVIKEY